MYMHMHMHMHMHVYAYACVSVVMHMYLDVVLYMHVSMCVHAYIHTYWGCQSHPASGARAFHEDTNSVRRLPLLNEYMQLSAEKHDDDSLEGAQASIQSLTVCSLSFAMPSLWPQYGKIGYSLGAS